MGWHMLQPDRPHILILFILNLRSFSKMFLCLCVLWMNSPCLFHWIWNDIISHSQLFGGWIFSFLSALFFFFFFVPLGMGKNVVEAVGNLYQKTHLLFYNPILSNVISENSLQLPRVNYIPVYWGSYSPDYLPPTPPKALESLKGPEAFISGRENGPRCLLAHPSLLRSHFYFLPLGRWDI